MRPFDSNDRATVWGRAVTGFQYKGFLIGISDPIGGVLRSEYQPTSVNCGNYASEPKVCDATIHAQFTMANDGTAFLRINRRMIGETYWGKSPLTPADDKALQDECDDLLDFIVGRSPKKPEPVPQAPSGLM
jgi:hypothetical protein